MTGVFFLQNTGTKLNESQKNKNQYAPSGVWGLKNLFDKAFHGSPVIFSLNDKRCIRRSHAGTKAKL